MTQAVDDVALHVRLSPRRLAAVEPASGRRWTYAELDRDIGACAGVLVSRGIGRQDRVAVLSRNRVSVIILQRACARLGAMMIPLNWRLGPAELADLVDDCDPALLVHDDGVDRGVPGLAIDALEAAVAAHDPIITGPIDSEAVSLILYTSGTSGRPKGAMLSERAQGETAINLALLGAIGRDSRALCDSPMFHVIGMVSNIRPMLMWGGAIVVSDGFVADRTLARLTDPGLGITHYFAVPQMVAALRAVPGFDARALGRLTRLFTGGAPHAPGDVRAWLGAGVPLSNGFGMTECGTVCHTPVGVTMPRDHAGSVGMPTPGVATRVVDAEDNELPPGQAGELQIRGANLLTGYWRRPEETAAAFAPGGWFRTGDIAMIDARGYHWLIDRKKDMFISGGENVYPAEIEAVLAGMPGVIELAIVGIPDHRWGEVGHVAMVLQGGAVISLADVHAHLADRIARYKLPRSLTVHDALPRTASGKVLKGDVRTLVLSTLSPTQS